MIGGSPFTAAVVGNCEPSHRLSNASARLEGNPRQLNVERCKIGGLTLPFGKAVPCLLDRPTVKVDTKIDERAGDAEKEPVGVPERIVRIAVCAGFLRELLSVDAPAFDKG